MKLDNDNPNFSPLDQATQLLREAAIPAGPTQQLVLETAAAMERPQRRLTPRAAILAVAAALLLAIGGWAWFSRSAGAEFAFADVMQEVAKTTSLEATVINNPDDPKYRHTAKLMIKGTHGRMEGDDGDIDIDDDQTGQDLNLNPKTKIAMHSVMSDDGSDLYAELRRMADSAPMLIGQRTFNGRVLDGFSGTGEFLGMKSVPVNVWVDPKSELPARIEFLSAAHGPAVTVFDDIRFDTSLDDSLFVAEVPKGYRVVEEGGLTVSQLEALPAATPAQVAQLVIKPKWGMGSLPFSATREQIVKALGEPANPPVPGVMDYPALGLRLSVDDGPRGLKQIQVQSAAESGRNIRDFPGRTQEGIRIGSGRREVEQAYGPTDDVNGLGDAMTFLTYSKLGMDIVMTEGGVADIIIFEPHPQRASEMTSRYPATIPTPVIVVPLPKNPGPLPTEAQLQKLVITPGVGLGEVRLGSTRGHVIALMGQPQGLIQMGGSEEMIYSADGLNLIVDPNGVLQMIIANGPPTTPGATADLKVRAFAGWTDKHIHIGSTRDEVVAAYGKNYSEVGVMVEGHPEVHQTQLLYQKLGLVVLLDKQTNRCVELMLLPVTESKPPAQSPQ